jgi:hypothetical protein
MRHEGHEEGRKIDACGAMFGADGLWRMVDAGSAPALRKVFCFFFAKKKAFLFARVRPAMTGSGGV